MDALVSDIYEGDGHDGIEMVRKMVAAGWPWCGLSIKCSEGLFDWGEDWFCRNWPLIHQVASETDRYAAPVSNDPGKPLPFLRGCYHYARLSMDAIKQAHLFLGRVEKAGGWDVGDLWPFLDVEGANNPPNMSANQVKDWIHTYADEIHLCTGRRPGLYGNIYLWEHGVKDPCGCQVLWVSRETANLPPVVYQRIGWSWSPDESVEPPTLWGWQYCTDGQALLPDYPRVCPIGNEDITAIIVANGGRAGLDWTMRHLFAEDPRQTVS